MSIFGWLAMVIMGCLMGFRQKEGDYK